MTKRDLVLFFRSSSFRNNLVPRLIARLRERLTRAPAVGAEWNHGLPNLLMQGVEARTADDVVEIIYLQNDTERTWVATVRAKFSTTVDDESGAALHHGPAGTEVELAPGERARVGDVVGWEWDSARNIDIEFRHAEGGGLRRVYYILEYGGRPRHVAGLGDVYEVEPRTVRPVG